MYTPIRIVIADDHEIFRDGFKVLLKKQKDLELVGEAENGKDLLDVVAVQLPDIVITDIRMPIMDGIEACKKIRKKYPSIQVIALSMFNDENLIVDMLEAGARGYLLKNTTRHELLAATKAVSEGSAYYSADTSGKLTRMIAESRFNPYRNEPIKQFTSRELQIIRLMCRQLTNGEMAKELALSIRTIESHREKIQEKTGARNSIGIVIYAIKNGLVEV
jgi:DNA-binding NarL/FixJ family response regulator